jgi:hypothetical protein
MFLFHVKENPRFHVTERNASFFNPRPKDQNGNKLFCIKSHSPPHAVIRGGTLPTAGSSHPEIIKKYTQMLLKRVFKNMVNAKEKNFLGGRQEKKFTT